MLVNSRAGRHEGGKVIVRNVDAFEEGEKVFVREAIGVQEIIDSSNAAPSLPFNSDLGLERRKQAAKARKKHKRAAARMASET